jgi:hypothetical protein
MTISGKQTLSSLALITMLAMVSGLVMSKDKPENKVDKQNNKSQKQNNNKPREQWYLSNTISAFDASSRVTHSADNAAVLGKLTESSDGYDKHDITPFVSLSNAKAAIFFVQDNWGDRSGEYHSDYHSDKGRNDSWLMTVVSSIPHAQVTVKWDGLYALTSTEQNGLVSYTEQRELNSAALERLHLIDLSTLRVVEAQSPDGELGSYTFTLNEGETSRNLRWVLGPINSSYFEPGSGAMRHIKAQQREHAEQQREAEENKAKHGKFGLPPS